MNRHLNDEQIATAVMGGRLDPAVHGHLEECLGCRHRVTELEGLIELRRRRLDSEEPDWEAQRAAVLGRLSERPIAQRPRRAGWLRPLMAAAAALIVIAVVGLLRPERTEIASNGADIAVEEILAEVDELLADDSIPGFEVIDPGMEELESYLSPGTS